MLIAQRIVTFSVGLPRPFGARNDGSQMKNFTLDNFQLDGKTAVVTGGCGNLGPYWVLALLDAGANVVIVDLPGTIKPKELEKVHNKKLKIYDADITDLDDLKTIHKKIAADFGPIQILVNNAGIDTPPVKDDEKGRDTSQKNRRYLKMWDVNVQGMVNCIEEFYPDMKKIGGSIINIGSLYMERSPYEGLYTHMKFDKPWAYGATKAAVGQVTRHFATRLSKYNIRVNTISPGGVFANQDPEFVKKYSARVPQGRMANKETDLGGPLVFLASDASCYVTGINLKVNGGYTAW